MAQHDYVAANGSGAVVRGDFNDALLAVATMNSGATAPSTTYSYMPYVNTSDGHLYQRNAANTAWIDYGLFAERVLRTGDIAVGGSAGLLRADGDGTDLINVNGIPVGFTFWWPSPTPPGWALVQDGAAVSRTTYAALFAITGTAFGAGDGSTTYNLPDLRGEFIRGWDNGRGVDGSRVFGSAQSDELKSHSHGYHTNVGAFAAGGAAQQNFNGAGSAVSTNAFGGSETRPRNVALLPCIKF